MSMSIIFPSLKFSIHKTTLTFFGCVCVGGGGGGGGRGWGVDIFVFILDEINLVAFFTVNNNKISQMGGSS